MDDRARELARRIRQSRDVHVFAHIDTDGITGASIAAEALDRAGIDHRVTFLKKLDDTALASIRDANPDLAWFVDLGAGMLHAFADLRAVVTDHHVPTRREVPKSRRGDLFSFVEDDVLMLNPHNAGLGSDVVSGSGCAYLVARAMDGGNTDLAAIAVVGAVADVQDQEHRRLEGLNREILADGVAAGVLDARIDLRLFGRETRPLHRLLAYASDPVIPRLSGSDEAAIAFLLDQGIDLKDDDAWRSWADLGEDEKRRVLSALVSHMLERGCGWRLAERLVGEVYTLVKEPPGSPLRDAKEFSTLLNACGRYDEAEVGMRVCRGDRDDALKQALRLLRNHRGHLVNGLDLIEEMGITKLDHVQYFHAADKIRDTVVGITANMALRTPGAVSDLPMIAFADAEDGIKVSARGTRELVAKGLDLAAVMRDAATALGGEGGGHHAAAGATIPRGKEQEFLALVERLVRDQLTKTA
jgi:RecJ-like exonuclease